MGQVQVVGDQHSLALLGEHQRLASQHPAEPQHLGAWPPQQVLLRQAGCGEEEEVGSGCGFDVFTLFLQHLRRERKRQK